MHRLCLLTFSLQLIFATDALAQPVPADTSTSTGAKQGADSGFIDGWSIMELPDLPGGSHSNGSAVNDNGDIVGWYSGPFIPNRAFLFSDGKMTDLGTFGGPNSMATGINNRKTVAGYAYASPLTVYSFRYSAGAMHTLPALQATNNEATAINQHGDIVGGVTMPGEGGVRAFLYSNGTLTLLGSLGGAYSMAKAISQRGQIVGESYCADVASPHAVVFNKDGTVTDLGTLGGRQSSATGINDRGDVVGSSGTTMVTDRTPHAFIYKNGAMHDLGTLGGMSSIASAINNAGTIAGASEHVDGSLRAVIWEGGKILDLNELPVVAARGWTRLYTASSINERGQIAGSGFINGVSHAFLLTPKPSARR